MDEIKVDFKLICTTICITIIAGTILWLGYNFYESQTKDENEEIANFEGDMSSPTKVEGNKESNTIKDEIFLVPDPKKKFKINNDTPAKGMKDWATVTANYDDAGYLVRYSIPGSTTKLKGENIYSTIIDMSIWTEDGTYEDFIEDFIRVLKSQDGLEDRKYTTRKLNISGKEYYVVMREREDIIGSYFCLAQNGYSCHLGVIVEKKFYDDNMKDTIDKIFSTFTII